MKKLTQINFIMVAILFATMLVGCNKPKEQTSVDINDFTEKATIMGKLSYDEGQSLEGSNYVTTMKPAADITITAVVANSEYSATASGSGNLTFTTKTDAEGNFELSIPVTNSGVSVKLKATSFAGKYRSIVDVKNGQAVYSYEDVIYSIEEKNLTLEPNDVEFVDGTFSYEGRENTEESARIYGTLTYDEGQGFDGTNYTRLIKPAANIKITATVNGNTLTTQTDSNGKFQFIIPVTNSSYVTLSATSFTGQYHSIINIKDGRPVYRDEDVIYSFEDRTLVLQPNDIEIIDGVFSHEERENTEEFTYHSEYKVVVGQASYIKNTIDEVTEITKQYKNAANVGVIIDVEYDVETFTYVAETNSNGVATFHIPTTDLNWSPEIYVRVNKFVDDKFSYYKMEYDEDEGENKAVKYTLSGYFEQVSGYTDRPEFNDIEGMPTPEHRVKMNFFTFDADEDHGHSNENWYNIEF